MLDIWKQFNSLKSLSKTSWAVCEGKSTLRTDLQSGRYPAWRSLPSKRDLETESPDKHEEDERQIRARLTADPASPAVLVCPTLKGSRPVPSASFWAWHGLPSERTQGAGTNLLIKAPLSSLPPSLSFSKNKILNNT